MIPLSRARDLLYSGECSVTYALLPLSTKPQELCLCIFWPCVFPRVATISEFLALGHGEAHPAHSKANEAGKQCVKMDPSESNLGANTLGIFLEEVGLGWYFKEEEVGVGRWKKGAGQWSQAYAGAVIGPGLTGLLGGCCEHLLLCS